MQIPTLIERNSSDRKIMLFDLSIRGHHPSYIQHLINYWQKQELPGLLDIVVLPSFIQEHADVVKLASNNSPSNINFIAISPEEAILSSRKSRISRAFRAFQEWKLFCKYTDKLGATQAILLYFDTYQLPLLLGVKPSCPFSGIYFRPTFHYNEFTNYPPSWQERVQQRREKFILSRILRNPQLKTLFCLDPFAIKHLDKFQGYARAVYLPDPVQLSNNSEQPLMITRESLGIEPGRRVFLLFGSLTERKGVYQLLKAIRCLLPDVCQKICLLLVGESSIKASLENEIVSICQAQPVQIIRHYEFIPVQDVPPYFQLTDIVLTPYQRHVGMSAILPLAAAAQKPVLSSNYGLMGEIVRRYELGLTVDSTIPGEIAKGLAQCLLESPDKLCDRTKMKLFAQQNSTQQFANTFFQHV